MQTAKFCMGCGYPVVLSLLSRKLQEKGLQHKAVLGLDIGCSLLAWNYLPITIFQTHHGRVTPTVMGYKRARPDSVAIGLTGDGGAYSIGLQNLIHAARRDEPVLIIVANNTLYSMTGGQTAPTTMLGQITDTNPEGASLAPLSGPELLKHIVQPGAYIARSAVNEIQALNGHLEKAIAAQEAGHFALLEVLSYCPTNWKTKGIETNQFLETKVKPAFPVGVFSV